MPILVEPGPLLSERLLNELRNRPWMELRDSVQWGDFEVNWDLQQAGIETEFLAGRLGKSEYERLKFACSREISEFQMYFRIRSLPPFLAWARVAHRSLQQTVPIRIAESFLVVFDTTCADDACCPDSAGMCKHVAAVLYGIGARFDHQPEPLFRFRAVDKAELILKASKAAPLAKQGPAAGKLLGGEGLAGIFDLDMAQNGIPDAGKTERKPAKPKRARKAAGAPEGKRKAGKQTASTQRRKRSAGARKLRRPAKE